MHDDQFRHFNCIAGALHIRPKRQLQNPGLISKGPKMKKLICYCFEYTVDDIRDDYNENGKSLILERIAEEKKKNSCDCANKNPTGR